MRLYIRLGQQRRGNVARRFVRDRYQTQTYTYLNAVTQVLIFLFNIGIMLQIIADAIAIVFYYNLLESARGQWLSRRFLHPVVALNT